MLGDISGFEKICIVCGYTDMRKSIDGLCAIIEEQLKVDPASSALFLFCGRRRDRIKALFHEPDGFVLIYKRLSVRGGYQRPRKQSEVRDLSWREFGWLMSGICIDQPKALKTE
ncbi:IS66 family insertion sequence element accessory protein TnpB [Lachnospiraceae bacterium 38-14]